MKPGNFDSTVMFGRYLRLTVFIVMVQNEAESGLRLDLAEGIADAFSEMDLNENTGWQRLISKDPDEKMPPPAPGNEVSAEELVVLRQWISQGAGYEMHWSYVRPTRPDVPKTDLAKRVRNPIDAFVLRKLDQQRLSPSSEATREQLIRRLSLDLTGLPPSPAEVEAFVSDQRRDAYENLVDRLLGSRHFGERPGAAVVGCGPLRRYQWFFH